MNRSRKRRILSVFLATVIFLGMQGMTVMAESTGLGAAKPEQGGPGVAASQESQMEMEEAGSEQSEAGQLDPEQAGTEQSEPGQSGQEQTGTGQSESGQPEPEYLQVNYSGLIASQGWSAAAGDNDPCSGPVGTWVTAMRANLVHIPEGVQIGIRYQVNVSGFGWFDWAADGSETGDSTAAVPLEAIRMELTGSGAAGYDLYYKVLQNGSWTGWARNGETAGIEGAGLRVDGIRASITAKDAGAPSERASAYPIDPSRPMIALTFDDGPRTAVTSRILDSLQANGGRATFFMVGSSVNANAGVIKRMADQGCEVANHTHDHKYITKIGAQGIIDQLTITNQKIQAASGISPVLMRPPGGFIDSGSQAVVGSMGMSAIMWSIDTRDWQHKNPAKTIESVLSQVKDGDIILMHDIYSTTADAAEVLIPELTARGFQLVTISELGAYRGGIVPGGKYSQFWP